MAKSVVQQLKDCPNCGHPTLHLRNTKEMSWIVHLVLFFITAGFWLIVWIPLTIWHLLTKPIAGKWVCSICGEKG